MNFMLFSLVTYMANVMRCVVSNIPHWMNHLDTRR